MSLLAILIFTGTMVLSLWATIRVRQVYSKFSLLPASARSTGAETAVRILHQEGIYDVEIVKHDQALGDHYDPTHKRLVLIKLPVAFVPSPQGGPVVRGAGSWTHVAAFIPSLAYFLLHLLPLLGGPRE